MAPAPSRNMGVRARALARLPRGLMLTSRALRLSTQPAFAMAALCAPACAAGLKNPPQPGAIVAALDVKEQADPAPLSRANARPG